MGFAVDSPLNDFVINSAAFSDTSSSPLKSPNIVGQLFFQAKVLRTVNLAKKSSPHSNICKI